MSWLHKMREMPEYVETHGDPMNRITHAERAVPRVDAWEQEIDGRIAYYPDVLSDETDPIS